MKPNPSHRSPSPRLLARLGGLLLALSGPAHLQAQPQPPPAVPTPASTPAPVAKPAASLIKNGSFEVADESNPTWPAQWGTPNAGSYSWESEQGTHFIRLNVVQPGDLVMIYANVAIPPGVKAVELSLRCRVIGLKCGPQPWFDARLIADFKTATGQKLKGAKTISFRKDTDGWSERKVRFAVPEGGVALEIMPSLFKAYSGTFDIDELQLTPIDPAEVDAAPAAPAAPPKPAAPAP